VAAGTASIAVEGVGGSAITGPAKLPLATRYFRITLSGDFFKEIAQVDYDVTPWFTNLADVNLTAKIAYRVEENDSYAIIKIEGTPNEIIPVASAVSLTYVIPANRTKSGLSIKGLNTTPINYYFTQPSALFTASPGIGVITIPFTNPATPITPITFSIQLNDAANYFNSAAYPAGVGYAITPYQLPIGDWIRNAPNGLVLTTNGVSGYTNTLSLTLSGAPLEVNTQRIEVTVPATANLSGYKLHLPVTNDDRFNIQDRRDQVAASVTGGSIGPIVQGIPLPTPVDYSIELVNDEFASTITGGSTVNAWFPYLTSIGGLSATVVYLESDTKARVRITGTPTSAVTGTNRNIRVSIPSTALVATASGYIDALVPSTSLYDINAPTATISGTISGTVGTALPATDLTIALPDGNTFTASLITGPIPGWFNDIYPVTGLTYEITNIATDRKSLTVTVTGMPNNASSDWISVVIPATATQSATAITIKPSASASYAIAP
jgi:hypothetical protein